MKKFKDRGFKKGGGRFGGKPKFGGGKRFDDSFEKRGGRGDDAELFPARCSSCQMNCEVPFRPSSDKPVYCSACFNKKNSNAMRDFNKSHGERRDEVRSDVRPAYAERPMRVENQSHASPHTEDIKRQLANLESKLNRVLEIVNTLKSQASVAITEVAVPVKAIPSTSMTKVVVAKKSAVKQVKKVVAKKVSSTAKVIPKKSVTAVVKKVSAPKKSPAKSVAKVAQKKVAITPKKVAVKKSVKKK